MADQNTQNENNHRRPFYQFRKVKPQSSEKKRRDSEQEPGPSERKRDSEQQPRPSDRRKSYNSNNLQRNGNQSSEDLHQCQAPISKVSLQPIHTRRRNQGYGNDKTVFEVNKNVGPQTLKSSHQQLDRNCLPPQQPHYFNPAQPVLSRANENLIKQGAIRHHPCVNQKLNDNPGNGQQNMAVKPQTFFRRRYFHKTSRFGKQNLEGLHQFQDPILHESDQMQDCENVTSHHEDPRNIPSQVRRAHNYKMSQHSSQSYQQDRNPGKPELRRDNKEYLNSEQHQEQATASHSLYDRYQPHAYQQDKVKERFEQKPLNYQKHRQRKTSRWVKYQDRDVESSYSYCEPDHKVRASQCFAEISKEEVNFRAANQSNPQDLSQCTSKKHVRKVNTKPKAVLKKPKMSGWVIGEKQSQTVVEQGKNRQYHRDRSKKWRKRTESTDTEPGLMKFSRSPSQLQGDDHQPEDSFSDSDSVLESEFSYQNSRASADSSEEDSFQSAVSIHNQAKGEIAVFWDTLSCSVPTGKSVRCVVKKIRQTFYGGRKEDGFTLVCDITKLATMNRQDLTDCHVDLIHVASDQGNTIDVKLEECLQRFAEGQKPKGSCVVLISENPKLNSDLFDSYYRNQIHVVLIHKQLAEVQCLDLVNETYLFDEFVSTIPEVTTEGNNVEFKFLLLENIPKLVERKAFQTLKNVAPGLKGTLKTKIKNGSCLMQFSGKDEADQALSYFTSNKLRLFESLECNIRFSSGMSEWESLQASYRKNNPKPPKNQKAANIQKPVTNCLPKKTYILLIESKNIYEADFWKSYLRDIVKESSFMDVTVKLNQVYILFESLGSAKRMKYLLLKHPNRELKVLGIQRSCENLEKAEEYTVTQRVTSLIDSCKLSMEKKHVQLLMEHTKKKTRIEVELSSFLEIRDALPQNTNLSEFGKLTESIKATESKIEELTKQEDVFNSFFSRNMNILESYGDQELTLKEAEEFTSIVKKELGKECHLFSQALPIYAQKTKVIDLVQNNPVSIILAETGSGKSTQIVQYLVQAGFGDNGKIVCTQPRKLAARSLAEYVSNQMGSALGKLVGFKVGLHSKCCEDTRILYMTDHCLLNECLKDPELTNYSCVIVDEVHERSIFTDILLGMLKKLLTQRQYFKLVLTSATINPKVFQNHFGIGDEALLSVSGRTFPIEVKWGLKTVNTNYDYVNQSVMKAFEIHMSEESGHILVFLATPAETLKACDMLEGMVRQKRNSLNAICLPLHGKLGAEEQRKVFSVVPNNTRKIIFATNCAETSITVPGVCFVVDTGIAKELIFEPKTQSNILKLCMITRSSAEQRKGRAGRTQAGKCYRLFSKDNYELMAEDMKPEIMRVNLGQALLKLMELGIKNPCEFEFVESPSQTSFQAAMDNLYSLGAVENDQLSELGCKMAKLPLEPSLSKLVIRGFQEQVGYEAVITATLASVSGMIFFRLEENKEAADLKKTEFCQEEGDFHTFLEVYKKYLNVPKTQKSQWCVTNYINGKSMKITHDGVRDLLQTYEQEFGISIPVSYSQKPDVKEILQFLILEIFKQNLCVYSGHRTMGYISLKNKEMVNLHPSSCLSYLGKITPPYVVYQTNIFTTKNYMTSVTPVSEKCLSQAIENGLYQKETIDELQDYVLAPLCFGPFGTRFLRLFCGAGGTKRRNLEEQISKETNETFLKIEVDFQSGKITIFCKNIFHSRVSTIANEVLKNLLDSIKDQIEIISLEGHLKGISYVLGAGAVTSDCIMPEEYAKFTICDLEPSFDLQKLIHICKDYNEPFSYKEIFRKKGPEIVLTFRKVKAAMNAAKKIPEIFNCQVKPNVGLHTEMLRRDAPFFQLVVTWIRRPARGFAFITFENNEDFHMYSPKLTCCHSLAVNYESFLVKVSKKQTEQLFIPRIPKNITQSELEKAISSVLEPDVKFRVQIPYEKPFPTSDEELDKIKSTLESVFSMYTPREGIIVHVFKPRDGAIMWRARISFCNAKDGQITYNAFKGYQTYPNTLFKFNISVEINSTIVCHKDIFDISKAYMEEAFEGFKKARKLGDNLKIEARPSKNTNNFVVINLHSNNIVDMENARNVLQEILKGDIIECLGIPLLEKLFLPAGKSELRKIEQREGSKIHLDFIKKTVSIIGSEMSRTKTKVAINNYLDILFNHSNRVISLAFPKRPQGLLKLMLKEYGSDLGRLKTSCNLFSIEMDIQKHALTVFGSNESVEKAEDLINELGKTISTADPTEEESCPVCLSPVVYEEPHYRLQCCGHVYCRECIDVQIKDCRIPMTCVAEDCEEPFVMVDFQELLNEELRRMVAESSLKHLVQNDKKQFKFCPTPECPVVYKVLFDPAAKSQMTCRKCTNQICIRCHSLYHHGYTCEMYQMSKEDEDFSVKMWMKENSANRKACPKCNVGIEKNGGCNHMTCWSCQAHMCWPCMKVFSTATEVYNHQPYCMLQR